MVQQVPDLIEMSVADNLRLAADLAEQTDDFDRRVEEVLQLVHLSSDFLPRTADDLSVGQRQRATIARALIARPRVLLLDEPTSALDPTMSASLVQTIRRIHAETGLTVMLVSHRWEELRQSACRVGVLIEGELREVGPAEQVLAHPQNDAVRRMMGTEP
jgi:ABC-type methionine transport system ATPase subunit